MSYFSVKLVNLRRAETELQKVVNRLEQAADRINQVTGAYIFSSEGSLQQIRKSLKSVSNYTMTLEQRTKELKSTLGQIASVYEKAEQKILGHQIQDAGIKQNLAEGAKGIGNALKELFGMAVGGRYSPDPVNLSTGNYIYEKRMLGQEGIAAFEIILFYNSMSEEIGLWGKGWFSNLEIRLEVVSEEQLCMVARDAARLSFALLSDGVYRAVRGDAGSMIKTENGYLYFDAEQHYVFSKEGKLLLHSDKNANGVQLLYGENGQLSELVSTSGFRLFCRFEEERLVEISDRTARTISFEYKDEHLSAIIEEEGERTEYRYNENGLLSELISPTKVTSLMNDYDEKARVIHQKFPDGGEVFYQYQEENREVVYTEQNGNQIRYLYDENYNNIQTCYMDGTQKSEYDKHGRQTVSEDKKGNRTEYQYDTNGNLSVLLNAVGDKLEMEHSRLHQPLRVFLNQKKLYDISYDESGNPVSFVDADGRNETYEYNEAGQVVKVSYADGSKVLAEYDEKGNLVRLIGADGNAETYQYDSYGRVVTCIDSLGNQTEISYYANNNIRTVKNAEGNQRHYQYDGSGNLTKLVDFDGSVISMEYNEINKLSRYTDQNGNSTQFVYDAMWNLEEQIDPNGGKTRYGYDRLHRLIRITDPLGNTIDCERDENGNMISRKTASKECYRMEYDALDRPVKVIRPDGTFLKARYDALGRVVSVIDSEENETKYTYNFNGNLLKTVDASGYQREQTYDLMGNLTEVSDKTGWLIRYQYYSGGFLKKEEHVDGSSKEYTYDANRNVKSQTDQDGNRRNFIYDCLNRLIRTESEDGNTESYEYDAVGNITAITDAEGNKTTYTYSPTGQVTSMTDALGTQTFYQYDCMDRLISVIQPEFGKIDKEEINRIKEISGINKIKELNRQKDGYRITSMEQDFQTGYRITSMERDLIGNIIRQTDAAGQTSHYFYDSENRLSELIDEDGNSTRFMYEFDGLPKEILYADGRSVEMSYSPLRHLKQIQDWNGKTLLERDATGRLLSVTDPKGEKIEYCYNSRGQRTKLQYPDGMTVAYEYNEKSQLIALTEGDTKVSYSYYSGGNLKNKMFSGGEEYFYQYNNRGLVETFLRKKPDGSSVTSHYQYDRMNRKISESIESMGTTTNYGFSYTPVGCLAEVLKDGVIQNRYEYDIFGNRVKSYSEGEETINRYNCLNQLIESSKTGGKRFYDYDGRGNLICERNGERALRQFQFGLDGMLERAQTERGSVKYSYNGLRQRTMREAWEQSGGLLEKNHYTYDMAGNRHTGILRIRNQRKNQQDSLNLVWDTELLFSTGKQGRNRFENDALGSPISFFADGKTDRFGVFGGAGISESRFGFAGYLAEPITETYYAGAREYEPSQGRFLSRDPVTPNFASPNLFSPNVFNPYLYCRNDPLNYTDPSGLIWVHLAIGIVSAVGNVVNKVVSSVISGEAITWQGLVGTAVGGFAGGVMKSFGISPTVAGAISNALETGVTGLANKISGATPDTSWGDLATNMMKSAATGAITGWAFANPPSWFKVPGLTSGKGSYGAVFKQIVTKAGKGMIQNITWSTFAKCLIYQITVNTVTGVASGVKNLLKNGIGKQTNPEKENQTNFEINFARKHNPIAKRCGYQMLCPLGA